VIPTCNLTIYHSKHCYRDEAHIPLVTSTYYMKNIPITATVMG